AWGINTVFSTPYAIPTELRGVDMYSPDAMKQRLAEIEREIYWKNGLIYFAVLGIGFGLAPLLMIVGSGTGKPGRTLATGVIGGLGLGALAFFVTAELRRWLNTGVELPLLGHAGESLSGDVMVFALASFLVTLPTLVGLLLLGIADSKAKAITVPLAAIVAGLLIPIAVSIVMPQQSTKDFPPIGSSILALWLAILALLMILFMTTTGDKQRAKSAHAEVQP
ncbi:MAG TPA: hypothetical protein DDZ51_28000, partial [Planctomycetaceae bacterium]|nr:hypothetical protein [Planctomycetaceae bacterium]